MLLLFQPSKKSLDYAAFAQDASVVYDGTLHVTQWSIKALRQQFDSELLTRLRGHGKVFTKVGIVVPFADTSTIRPVLGSTALLKKWGHTPLRQSLLEPSLSTFEAVKAAWPHLPIYFLNDAHLSHKIDRTITLPPFSYDTNHDLHLEPMLLHSYGHTANLASVDDNQTIISLYVGEQTSAALFVDGAVKDVIATYSPLSPIMGMHTAGNLDSGTLLELGQRKRPNDLVSLVARNGGLHPMTESNLSIDDLVHIAGLVPRKDMGHLDELSIEAIEWIELSVRSFVKQIRHALGALATSEQKVDSIVVGSDSIPAQSQFWGLLASGSLSKIKFVYAKTTLLSAACKDLVDHS